MGELPPSCSTPQGPGVPRASRPGFLRVDSSGTSSAPLSRSVSFPFLSSSSLHFTHLLSPGAFPPPSRSPFPPPSFPFLSPSLRPVLVQFSPVLSTVRYSFLHGSLRPRPLMFPSASFPSFPSLRPVPVGFSASFLTSLPGSFSSPFHAYLLGIVLCFGFRFPRCRFGYVFLSFLLRFLRFLSPSFPFLSSSSLQFSPPSSSSVLPPSSRPYGVPTLLPFPFLASGSRVLPPLSRGSVSVARGSRRSAPTPLQRSGKVSRERWNT